MESRHSLGAGSRPGLCATTHASRSALAGRGGNREWALVGTPSNPARTGGAIREFPALPHTTIGGGVARTRVARRPWQSAWCLVGDEHIAGDTADVLVLRLGPVFARSERNGDFGLP